MMFTLVFCPPLMFILVFCLPMLFIQRQVLSHALHRARPQQLSSISSELVINQPAGYQAATLASGLARSTRVWQGYGINPKPLPATWLIADTSSIIRPSAARRLQHRCSQNAGLAGDDFINCQHGLFEIVRVQTTREKESAPFCKRT